MFDFHSLRLSLPFSAAATVHWGLVASSPHFDNAPSAKADGEWGFWSINADQVSAGVGTTTTQPDQHDQPKPNMLPQQHFLRAQPRASLGALGASHPVDSTGSSPCTMHIVGGCQRHCCLYYNQVDCRCWIAGCAAGSGPRSKSTLHQD